MKNLTDAQLEKRVLRELESIMRSWHEPAMITLMPHDTYALIGLVQLAAMHPGCVGYPREVAEKFVEGCMAFFDPNSAIAESIRRGWNPR